MLSAYSIGAPILKLERWADTQGKALSLFENIIQLYELKPLLYQLHPNVQCDKLNNFVRNFTLPDFDKRYNNEIFNIIIDFNPLSITICPSYNVF